MPDDDALDIWLAEIEVFPAAIISSAVDYLIASYKYPSPPKPADLIGYIKRDHRYKRALNVKIRIEMIEKRLARAASLQRSKR